MIVANLTGAVDQLMVETSALLNARQQTIDQALGETINRLHGQLGEATAQLQNGAAHESAETIGQHFWQISASISTGIEAQLLQSSTLSDTKSKEVLAAVNAAVGTANAQLQALPGIAQKSIVQALNTLAAEGKVELPYRLTYARRGDSRPHVLMVRPDGERASRSISVRRATLDSQTGRYSVDVAMPGSSTGGLPVTLTWTPAKSPAPSSPTTTPIAPPLQPTYTGVELEPLEVNVEAYPGLLPDGNDLIVTFPAEAGLDPLYIVFNAHHYHPAPMI